MHLYGFNASTCTRRVLFVAAELDLLDQIEYHKVDLFKGEHKDPAYVKDKQPFGQVPYLEDPDEGVKVYEQVPPIPYCPTGEYVKANMFGQCCVTLDQEQLGATWQPKPVQII